MSIENATQFLSALKTDESLGRNADDAIVDALHSVGSAAGHDFGKDDLRAAMDGAGERAALDELSEAEMDQVVAAGAGLVQGIDGNTVASSSANTVFRGAPNALTITINGFSSFSKSGFRR